MVSQTPLAQLVEEDNSEVNAKFKEIEESINSLVTALSTKNVSDQEFMLRQRRTLMTQLKQSKIK